MNKDFLVGLCVSAGLFGTLQWISFDKDVKTTTTETIGVSEPIEIKQDICDGYDITTDCVYDGIEYSVYLYHEEIPEKTHTEENVTYTYEITGYCTLCNDGTRSPSCSTGRGTCSHHGGVREWNAPIYKEIEHVEYITVVDSEKVEAYWEKVEKNVA